MNILGPSKPYTQMLDEHLAEQYEKEKMEARYPLRPSSAGYCNRKLAYDLAAYEGVLPKVPEERKPSTIRLLQLGHAVEFHALGMFQKIPGLSVKFKQQVVTIFKLDSGKLIEGSTDSVFYTEGHKGLADVKSVGNRWSSHYQDAWDEDLNRIRSCQTAVEFGPSAFWVEDVVAFLHELGEHALVANITQINLYCLTDFMKERGIDHGVVYRYEKNSSKHCEIRFKPSPELFERTKQEFNEIEKAVAAAKSALEQSESTADEATNQDLPNPSSIVEQVKKSYALGSKACAYCPYNSRCWPNAGKRDLFSGFPGKKWPVDLAQLERGAELEALLAEWEEADKHSAKKDKLEKEIALLIHNHEVNKVRTEDKKIYEIKELKSGLVLRRSKL